MRVAILAPIASSDYSLLVASFISMGSDVELVGVVVRSPFSCKRVRNEFQRDGIRLLEKVLNKVVLKNVEQDKAPDPKLQKMIKRAKRETLRTFCRQQHIPYLVTSDHNSKRAVHFLKEIAPDVIAFTGGGLIRKEVLAIPRLGVLNCHSGILPDYRGMDVVEWPIAEGRMFSVGLTLHFMDQGVDTGPILDWYYLHFQPGVTLTEIRKELARQMPFFMLQGLRNLGKGKTETTVQSLDRKKQYYVIHPRLKAYAETCLDAWIWPKAKKPKFKGY